MMKTRIVIVSLLAMLLLNFQSIIAQKAFYVKSGVTSGDTSATLSAAIARLSSFNRDTIIVMPGTYTSENINLFNISNKRIYVTSLFSRDTTKRNFISSTIFDGATQISNGFIYNSSGGMAFGDSVTIIGLTIQNFTQSITSGPQGLTYLKMQDCNFNNNGNSNGSLINYSLGTTEIIHCAFNNNAGTITLSSNQNLSSIQIKQNSFINHTTSGNSGPGGFGWNTALINIGCCGTAKTKIENNLFYNCTGASTGYTIYVNNPGTDSTIILNNTFLNNDINSIKVDGTNNICLIQNNLFNSNNRNSTSEFAFASSSKVKLYSNVTFLAFNKYTGFNTADTSNSGFNYVNQDMKFINKYYPSSQSPFIGLGHAVGIPSVDLDGNLRINPVGSSPEIGSFESVFSLVIPSIQTIEATNRKITISWNNSIGAKVKGVAIYRATTNNLNSTNYIGFVRVEDGNSFIDSSNIQNGNIYHYAIKTVGSVLPVSDSSAFSPSVSAISSATTLATPTSFSGSASPARIKLTWNRVSSLDTIRYNIYRANDINGSVTVLNVGSLNNFFVDTTVLRGKTYKYKIKAVDRNNSASNFSDSILVSTLGKTWFVSNTGDDSDIGSEVAPMKTIQNAINNTIAGDTILLKKGTYTSTVAYAIEPSIHITSYFPRTQDSTDLKETIIDGTGGNTSNLISGNFTSISLAGLTFQNIPGSLHSNSSKIFILRQNIFKGTSNYMMNSFINTGANSELRNNTFSNFTSSINVQGTTTIDGNTFWLATNNFNGNTLFSTSSSGSRTKINITNNLFVYSTSLFNLYNSNISDSIFFLNNTFIFKNLRGAATSINFGSNSYRAILKNNIFFPADNFSFGSMNSSVHLYINNNLLNSAISTQTNIANFNLKDTSNNLYKIDPGFVSVNSDNYKLKSNSQLLGAGTKDQILDNDNNGVRPFPANSNPDLGAFENIFSLPAPIISSIEGGNERLNLNFSIPSKANIDSFYIYRTGPNVDQTLQATIPTKRMSKDSLTYLDTNNIINKDRYYYRIKAKDANGNLSDTSNLAIGRANTPPTISTNLQAFTSPSLVKLEWSHVDSSISTFNIYRGISSNTKTLIGSNIKSTYFIDSTGSKGVSYYYAIKTLDSVGAASEFSTDIIAAYGGKKWYVNGKADKVGIGSIDRPFKRVSDALRYVSANDTVQISPGTYSESLRMKVKPILLTSTYMNNLNQKDSIIQNTIIDGSLLSLTQYLLIDSSNSSNNYATIKGLSFNNSANTILNANRFNFINARFVNNASSNALLNGSYLVFDSCSFINNGSTNYSIGGSLGNFNDSVVIRNSFFTGNKSPNNSILNMNYYNNSLVNIPVIENNRFINNGGFSSFNAGVVGLSGITFKLRNNIFTNNTMGSISLNAQSSMNNSINGIDVFNNTIIANKSNGILLNSNSNSGIINIINNIIQANSSDIYVNGVSPSLSTKVNFINNLIGINGGDSVLRKIPSINRFDTTASLNNRSAEFQFIDTANQNYALTNNSIALGFGNNTAVGLTKDFYGNPRPNPAGSNMDLGAIESIYSMNAPLISSAEASNKQVKLEWNRLNNTRLNKYYIYRSTSLIDSLSTLEAIDSVASTANFYIDSNNINNLTKYFYRIKAGDLQYNKSAFSNPVNVTPNKPLVSPVAFAYQSAPRVIKLTWSDTTQQATGFNIYRGLTKSSISFYKKIGKTNSFNDTSVVKSIPYYYYIKSIDSVGAVSDSSAIITAINTGNIFYVDKAQSLSGIGSIDDPMSSIQSAINVCKSGDSILVKPGVYFERLSIDSSITIGSLFMLNPSDTASISKTIVNGSTTTNYSALIGLKGTNNMINRTLSLRGLQFEQFNGSLINDSRILILSNCILNSIKPNCSSLINGNNNSIIEKSKFFNTSGQIYLASNSIISQNLFLKHNGSCNSQFINGSSSKLKITNNLFIDLTGTDLSSTGNDSTFILNNTFYKSATNASSFIRFDSYSNTKNLVYNNIFNRTIGNDFIFNAVFNGDSSTTILDISYNFLTTALTSNSTYSRYKTKSRNNFIGISPSFNNISNNDFSLTNSSRAIGIGLDTLFVPKIDFYSLARPFPAGSKPDLGAIESKVGLPSPQITNISAVDKLVSIDWKVIDTSSIMKFRIFRSNTDSLPTTLFFESATASVSSITDTSVQHGSWYNYRIQSVKKDLTTSDYSAPARVYIYAPPVLSYPLANSTSINLNDSLKWNTQTNSVSYDVQLSKQADLVTYDSATTTISSFELSKMSLKQNTNYFWKVRVRDMNSTSFWSGINKFQSRIASPIISDTNYISDKTVMLTLNFDTTGIKAIKIYRALAGSNLVRYDSLPTALVYNDTLNYLTSTKYAVSLINSANVESEQSNPINITTYPKPILGSPTNAQSNISLKPSFTWQTDTLSSIKQIQISNDTGFISFKNGFDVIVNSNTFNVVDSTKLLPNTNYVWRVRTGDKNGFSNWSTTSKFQSYVEKPLFNSIKAGNKVDTLSWTLRGDSSRYLKTYIYRDTTTTPNTIIDSVVGATSKYIDTLNLVLHKTYYYRLKVSNIEGSISEFSNVLSSTPFNKQPIPISLTSKNFDTVGEFNTVRLIYSSSGSYDPDGKIVSYKWYVNDSIVNQTDSVLVYYFKHGLNRLKLEITDNDGIASSSTANVRISAFVRKFAGGILGGITALNENTLYTADSSYDAIKGSTVFKIDRSGNTVYPIIVGSKVFTTPSVSSDSAVFITSGSSLNGFNSSGAPLWPALPLGGLSYVTPTIDSIQSRLYVGVSNANFLAIDYKTGKSVWNVNCDAPINSSAIITGDRKLVFASDNGTLYGFDLKLINDQPSPTWKFTVPGKIVKSPAVDSLNNLYFGTTSGNLVKLRLDSNGVVTTLWTTGLNAEVKSSPVIDAKGFIYIGTESGKFYKLDPNSGNILWSYSSTSAIRSTPTISDFGSIYIADIKGNIVSLTESGSINWRYQDSSAISSNLLSINSMLYVGTESGKLIGFYDNPNTNTVNTSYSYNFQKNKHSSSLGSLASQNNIGKLNLNIIADQLFAPLADSKENNLPVWGTFQGNYRRTGSKSFECPEVPIIQIPNCITTADSIQISTSNMVNRYWVINDVKLTTVTSNSIVVKKSDKYKLEAFNNIGCTVSSGNPVLVQNTDIAKPKIMASNGTGQICEGDSLNLISSIDAVKYQWSYAGSPIANQQSKTLKTQLAGSYSLTVINNYGCTSTSDVQLVMVNKIPTAPFVNSNSYCQNAQAVPLSVTTTTNDTLIYYTTATGGTGSRIAPTPNTTVVGTFSYFISQKNASGCEGPRSKLDVIVTALPTINGNLTVCIGSSSSLNGSGSPANTNAWLSSNTSVATIDNAGVVRGLSIGTTTITYTNASGCSQIATVTVTSLPTITGNLSVCIGSSSALVGSGTPANTNAWISSNNAVATVDNAGVVRGVSIGTVTITYTNTAGCSQNATVVISALPAKPTITANGSTVFCTGGSVVLKSSSNIGNQWYKDGQLISNATADTYTANSTGKYSVRVTGAGSCVVISDEIQVSSDVTNSVSIPIINGASTETSICFKDSILLRSTNYYDRYLWSNGDTTATTTIKNTAKVTLRGAASGSTCYSLPSATTTVIKNLNIIPEITLQNNSLIATNSNNYKWFRNNLIVPGVTANTLSNPSIGVYRVETSLDNNCWDISPDFMIVTSSSPILTDTVTVSVYPNPSSGVFNVVADFRRMTNVITKVTVVDIAGKVVYQSQRLLFFSNKIMLPVNLGSNKGVFGVHMDINGTIKSVIVVVN